MRCLALALMVLAVVTAPPAAASPECVKTTPTTTQCQTPGHTQIVTSPPVMNTSPWNWPYGGGLGLGFPW